MAIECDVKPIGLCARCERMVYELISRDGQQMGLVYMCQCYRQDIKKPADMFGMRIGGVCISEPKQA